MRSDKRGGSLTKSSLFPFCIRPPIQLYCGLKGFQNCKCTVHYAPCLWRNTSASRSKFKETPFKVKWQGKYWSNWFCSIHVHSILISLTFFFLMWNSTEETWTLWQPWSFNRFHCPAIKFTMCLTNITAAQTKPTHKVMSSSVRRQFAKPVLAVP